MGMRRHPSFRKVSAMESGAILMALCIRCGERSVCHGEPGRRHSANTRSSSKEDIGVPRRRRPIQSAMSIIRRHVLTITSASETIDMVFASAPSAHVLWQVDLAGNVICARKRRTATSTARWLGAISRGSGLVASSGHLSIQMDPTRCSFLLVLQSQESKLESFQMDGK